MTAEEDPVIRELVGIYEADIAILNAGGARIAVPTGDITVGTVYTLMPFGNSLAPSVLDLSGVQALDTGFIDAEVFMDYLLETGTLTPVESRITFIPID